MRFQHHEPAWMDELMLKMILPENAVKNRAPIDQICTST